MEAERGNDMNIRDLLTPFEKELAYHYKVMYSEGDEDEFVLMKMRQLGKKALKLFPSLFQLTISKEYDDDSDFFDVSVVDIFGGKIYTEILHKKLTFEQAYERMNELHHSTNIQMFK